MKAIIPHERIENRIYLFRGLKVMIDRDLANLYSIPTKVLKQSVRRNLERFPEDFMFELSKTEFENWRSQFVTSKSDRMGLRYQPLVFTEHGIAMLSSILKSKQAIAINIQIIRSFIKLRDMVNDNDSLRRKIESLEKNYDEQFKIVFGALRNIMTDDSTKPEIGYKH